jgi:hypothetical protein
MNNKTKFEIKIKLREEHIYDIYVNRKHIASRGSVEGVIEELKTLMEENV